MSTFPPFKKFSLYSESETIALPFTDMKSLTDIDKLAEEYADSIDRRLTSYHEGLKRGFKDCFVKYVKPQSEMYAASSVKDKTEQR